MKLIKEQIINEMAMERTDAIDRCISLGNQFLEHFHKLYKTDKDSNLYKDNYTHWIIEMQSWYASIKKITLKSNKKYLLKGNIKDWFLDCGGNPEDIVNMSDKEAEDYDTFSFYLLLNNNVKESLIKSGVIQAYEN